VWAALANAGKGNRAALKRALHKTARLCNKFSYTPSATVRLTKDIVELRFHALNDSSLDEGVQPFALTSPVPAPLQAPTCKPLRHNPRPAIP
jgi:hypothetical protein